MLLALVSKIKQNGEKRCEVFRFVSIFLYFDLWAQLKLRFSQIQVGWIYGSVIEDIVTGFKMHCRGWRSIYCIPARPAFKGSGPINLSDRLHQVFR